MFLCGLVPWNAFGKESVLVSALLFRTGSYSLNTGREGKEKYCEQGGCGVRERLWCRRKW